MKYLIAMAIALSIPTSSNAQTGPVGALGRFAIVHSPHTQLYTILLDTATGKTCQLQSDSTRVGDPLMWVPLTRVDDAGEFAVFLKHYPDKPNPYPKP